MGAGLTIFIRDDVEQGNGTIRDNIHARDLPSGIGGIAKARVGNGNISCCSDNGSGGLVTLETRVVDIYILSRGQLSASAIGGVCNRNVVYVDVILGIYRNAGSAGVGDRDVVDRQRATPRVGTVSNDDGGVVKRAGAVDRSGGCVPAAGDR